MPRKRQTDAEAPRWFTYGERMSAFSHLLASGHHLQSCDRFGFAQELIVQALDVLPERDWAAVITAARRELRAEKV